MVVQEVPRIRPLFRDEYEKLAALGAFEDERIELLEGALVEMSPPGPPHSSSVDKLTMLLAPAVVGRACSRRAPSASSQAAARRCSRQQKAPAPARWRAHPEQALLVIEVSESSLKKDRGIKQRIYARNGTQDYWIVNLVEHVIELYREPQGERYTLVQRFAPGDSITPLAFPELLIPVNSVL